MGIRFRYLGALAQHLEILEATAPNKRRRQFHMHDWIVMRECGTSACALGEACYIPLLRKAGLRMYKYDNKALNTTAIPAIVRCGKRYCGTYAAKHLFGISISDADWLFLPQAGDSNTPGKVAERIRAFIAREKVAA